MDLAKWPTNRLLNTAARLTENTEANSLRELGITQTGIRVLRALAHRLASTQPELARQLRVRPDTLGKTIDRLERSQLIVRSRSAAAERLRITPEGRILVERADELEEEQERTFGSDAELRAELIRRIKALGIGSQREGAPPALQLVPKIESDDHGAPRPSGAG